MIKMVEKLSYIIWKQKYLLQTSKINNTQAQIKTLKMKGLASN
jgi:hypothetical protein